MFSGEVYRVYVDESGRDSVVRQGGVRGKDRLFVVFAAVIHVDYVARLDDVYSSLVDREFVVAGRFRIRELFDLYRRTTGRDPEIKAGYLNSCEGPFIVFKHVLDRYRDAYEAFRREVVETMLRALADASSAMISVVVDKVDLSTVSDKMGIVLDPRLVAMDFLFTRIATRLEKLGGEAIVVHDETGRQKEVADLLDTLKKQGYFYNPRLRQKPAYSLIKGVEFKSSARCIPLQFVDLAANTVLRTRAGTSKEFYNIVAGSPKYLEVVYPRRSRASTQANSS